MKRFIWQLLTLLLSIGSAAPVAAAVPAEVTIDAGQPGPRVNPRMYGIFLEEINHSVDGGLYGELVRNRGFEDSRPPEGYTLVGKRWVDAGGFDSGFQEFDYATDRIPFWTLVKRDGAEGSVHLETSGGVTPESAYCARLEFEDGSAGQLALVNDGFFGLGVKEGESYSLSLYARGNGFQGALSAHLEDAAGKVISNEVELAVVGSEWQQHRAQLTATKTDAKARLVIAMTASGRVWLDFVSLFPTKTWKDRPNGMRPDIAQMIADLRPGFVRFPGGCVVEGATVETAYDWKLTVGPVEKRQERWGPWNYRRTQGMGLYEYFQFCADLGADPLYVGFCGQTCIFREREHVPMEEMGWVRDNFLDVVEYANGPADSRWGKLRADAGHPEPFELRQVEIGNENQGIEYGKRYRFVQEALAEKFSNLRYFADLSWTSRDSLGDAHIDVEDAHFYNSPRWFLSRFHEYDGRDRDQPPLYLGELAVTTGEAGPLRGNLFAALAEGVFLMGCERNADVVQMVSYAPLLANLEGRTALTGAPPPWHAMIYFDGTQVFGTASYYLWKLFGNNRPDQMVAVSTEFPSAKTPAAVAGQIGVGTWDATAEFKDIRVERAGQVLFDGNAKSDAKSVRDSNSERDGGDWSLEDGVYRQDRRGFGMQYFGSPEWSDYTLTLKARKLSGGEGFLIAFGRQGGERYWWNLGGWGNQQHAIELNQNMVGAPARGTIKNDRWYDIKIELTANRIRCYLDGKLVHDETSTPPERFFVTAGRSEADGALIVKAINTSDERQDATLKIRGMAGLASDATLTVLTSDDLADNNNLRNPAAVVPQESKLAISGNEISHEFPPHSFSIIRLSPQKQ
jgi:alpha-L-arabinofuranosidase